MYITTKTNKHHTVTDQSISPGEVRYTLDEAPEAGRYRIAVHGGRRYVSAHRYRGGLPAPAH